MTGYIADRQVEAYGFIADVRSDRDGAVVAESRLCAGFVPHCGPHIVTVADDFSEEQRSVMIFHGSERFFMLYRGFWAKRTS